MGQVTLVCSIDYTWYVWSPYLWIAADRPMVRRDPSFGFSSAQMITTALFVGSNGSIDLAEAPTFGILLAILFTHGLVCSAATGVLAKLNLFYVIINRQQRYSPSFIQNSLRLQSVQRWPPLWHYSYALEITAQESQPRKHSHYSKIIQDGPPVSRCLSDFRFTL